MPPILSDTGTNWNYPKISGLKLISASATNPPVWVKYRMGLNAPLASNIFWETKVNEIVTGIASGAVKTWPGQIIKASGKIVTYPDWEISPIGISTLFYTFNMTNSVDSSKFNSG
jgi:hypothetical protein